MIVKLSVPFLQDRYISQKCIVYVLVNSMCDHLLAESGLPKVGCCSVFNVCYAVKGHSIDHVAGLTNQPLTMLLYAAAKFISDAHKVASKVVYSECTLIPGWFRDVHNGQSYTFFKGHTTASQYLSFPYFSRKYICTREAALGIAFSVQLLDFHVSCIFLLSVSKNSWVAIFMYLNQ